MLVVNLFSVKENREIVLFLEGNVLFRQCDSEGILVHVLVEERPQFLVHLLAAADDKVGHIISVSDFFSNFCCLL